ncbi:MAG: hypothetical protein A4E28_01705 [Methanocella sp. PtaU1.Bin125]|nr:MAG: hypothetical protein A4E28_01705 [Methanocella sp. PtaU1.Bin125]
MKPGFISMGIVIMALIMAAIAVISPAGDASGDAGDATGVTPVPDRSHFPPEVPSRDDLQVTSQEDTAIDTTPGDGMGRTAKHIAYAYQPNVSDVVVFTSYWTVPERPAYDEYIKHTVFLWCGLQQGNLGLIQPVLEWDHDDTGKYWTIGCWIVNKRDHTYEVSRRFRAYPGDRIRADLRYITDPANPGKKVWYIAISDLTRQSMTYMLDHRRAVDTNQNLTLFSGVLEGTDLVRYDVDLPGDVTFEDVICKAEGGVDVPLSLTGYVHPDMGQVAIEFEDGPTGTSVIINTQRNTGNS